MTQSTDAGQVRYRSLMADSSLLAIFLISGVAAVGTSAVPVALPAIGATFDLSESGIGLVMSAFSFAVLVTHPVVGMLADFYGRRRVVLVALVVFGLAGLATLGVESYPVLLALRAVQGVAFAGTLPLTATMTGDLYTGAEGSAAQGIRSGFTGLSAAVAPVVAGLLVVVAWQYPFLLFAFALPVAAVVYWYFPDPVEPRDDGDGLLAGFETYWRRIWQAADRRLALLLAGGFVLFFLKGGFMTFLPVFVVSGLGLPPTLAGTLLGVYGGVRALVSPLAGTLVARLGRRYALVVGLALAALGLGALPATSGPWLLGAAAGLYAAGEGVVNPVLNDAVAASATDAQRAGIMSWFNILKDGALVVSPVVLGVVIGTTGYTTGFVAAAILGAVYGLVVLVRSSVRA